MALVIITAQVEDSAKWEEGFRSHGELLRGMTAPAHRYGLTDDNHVAVCAEPADLDKFIEVLESPATAEAMEHDGIKRETVKVFVVDKEFSY